MFKCLCHKMNLKMRVGENGLQVPKNCLAETPPTRKTCKPFQTTKGVGQRPCQNSEPHALEPTSMPREGQQHPARSTREGEPLSSKTISHRGQAPASPRPSHAHTHTQTHGPDCHGQRSDHPHNVWVLTSKIRL